MKVVGIVAEHNPFHNGHLYHIEKAKELCKADYVVSVMSGNFLQRGEPALFNKWARAKMAISAGVDMVVELPAGFAVRSASVFAHGSVSLLNSTGVVTHLCFGSEAGETQDLWPLAKLLHDEPEELRVSLNKHLDNGLSFPTARSRAIVEYFLHNGYHGISPEVIQSPNNILGIEYMKSLLSLGSTIEPVTVKRFASGYHDTDINRHRSVASATSIREELRTTKGLITKNIKNVVPSTTYEIMKEEILSDSGPVFIENYSKILFYLLRTSTSEYLASLCEVKEGLENRIIDAGKAACSVAELLESIKTKRYTWTRIQRILTYILLGFTASMAANFDQTGPRYIRVLGISDKGRALLKIVKKKANLPVIIRTAPYLAREEEIAEMLSFDVKATDIYTLLYPSAQILSTQGLDYKIMPYLQEEDC